MDTTTTIDALRAQVLHFRDQRNWEQFHTAKDLLLGLGIEVAELQELALWKDNNEIAEFSRSPDGRQRVREELADVFIFLLYLSRHFDVDLSQAVTDKLAHNARKYPVDKSYGSRRKYNEL